MSQVNKSMFKVNEPAEFFYNEKLRRGRVDKVGDSYVTLKLDEDKDGLPYKSFAFTGIKFIQK